MKVTKGHAFLLSEILLFAMFVITLFSDDSANRIVFAALAPLLIDAMQWITVGFIGLNVMDNGVKGKFFQNELKEK